MPEKLKDIFFTKEKINEFATKISDVYPKFNTNAFLDLVFDEEWESRELKSKMRHISTSLEKYLPKEYESAIHILIRIAPYIKGFEGMVLPDYVEVYGLDYWELSLNALKEFTKYSSSEFAIRPFLLNDSEKVMKYMLELADSKNEHLCRFASEGCRPRLPWAMALPQLKKNPSPIIPILEKLKNHESEYVRRSVANNLNDISKDNPEIVLNLCEHWIGKSAKTDWVVKHACRTLLKAGDKRALILFGYEDPSNVLLTNITFDKKKVKIGDYLRFLFSMKVKTKQDVKLRLEYAIDYLKSNGSHSRKVFKITENSYKPGVHDFSKRHSFAEMTTRKHYVGQHHLSIIVNGENKITKEFYVY